MSDNHKHADLMLQYALDAMETREPWKRWLFIGLHGEVTVAMENDFFISKSKEGYRRRPDAPPVPWHLLNKSTRSADVSKKLKPIDMSVLVESGIDCEFGEGRIGKLLNICKDTSGVYYRSSIKDRQDYRECRPRMNHWHSWQGGECPVPEGVMGDVLFRDNTQYKNEHLCFWQWKHEEHEADIIAFRVTGLADGYCWPWEAE